MRARRGACDRRGRCCDRRLERRELAALAASGDSPPRAFPAQPASVHSMIRTLAVISQKGGSGKTTLALALAAAHELAGGQAALIDLDPRKDRRRWGDGSAGVSPRR